MKNLEVYFGTIIRAAPLENAGNLVKLNWDTKEIESKRNIRPRNPDILYDPNVRGNTRGCRGIEIKNEKIIAANYHTLEIYDENLEKIESISHNLMVNNHELHLYDNNSILIASTDIDAVLDIDLSTGKLKQAYYPREMKTFQEEFDLTPLEFDKNSDNRTYFVDKNAKKQPAHIHLNAVRKWKGEVYALLNEFGAVVNLTREKVVIQNDDLTGAHNLIFLNDGTCFINNTKDISVWIFDINKKKCINNIDLKKYKFSKTIEKDLKKIDPMKKPSQKVYQFLSKSKLLTKVKRKLFPNKHFLRQDTSVAKSFFVRGLDVVEDNIFVGISPASIIQINWKTNEFIDGFRYTDNVKVAIHGLKVKS